MDATVSYKLQNPTNEAERMQAWSELLTYLEEHPEDREAQDLYAKYHVLPVDWTQRVVSTR